jgi:hypothetical protein
MQDRTWVHRLGAGSSTLLRIGRRLGDFPAIVFASLSLAFGLAIIVVNPPLRGPDEISHFLRIHSYARGELLPTTAIDGRKGLFVERELYDQLYFFKGSGESFAKARNEGVRYGEIMAEYRSIAGAGSDEVTPSPMFAPFAGTEGYSPVTYAP